MKRIAVGLVSLSMLVATAQADYDHMTRGDHYRRTREKSTRVGHKATRNSFQMDYRRRTSNAGREHRANMRSHNSGMSHHRTGPQYERHMYESGVVGERRHHGWIGERTNPSPDYNIGKGTLEESGMNY